MAETIADSVFQRLMSASCRSQFHDGLQSGTQSGMSGVQVNDLPEGPCKLCQDNLKSDERKTPTGASAGETQALTAKPSGTKNNRSSTCEIM